MLLPDYWAALRLHFTFLRGASSPAELVERARELGYQALALTDECSMAGVVRAHGGQGRGPCLLLGSQFCIQPRDATEAPCVLVVLAQNLNGYGNLCAFITKLRRSSEKGRYPSPWTTLPGRTHRLSGIALPGPPCHRGATGNSGPVDAEPVHGALLDRRGPGAAPGR